MWKVKNLKTNEEMIFETRLDVALWFNYFEDVYDDNVWDEFVKMLKNYEFKWDDDEPETFDHEMVHNFLNALNKEDDDDDLPF